MTLSLWIPVLYFWNSSDSLVIVSYLEIRRYTYTHTLIVILGLYPVMLRLTLTVLGEPCLLKIEPGVRCISCSLNHWAISLSPSCTCIIHTFIISYYLTFALYALVVSTRAHIIILISNLFLLINLLSICFRYLLLKNVQKRKLFGGLWIHVNCLCVLCIECLISRPHCLFLFSKL